MSERLSFRCQPAHPKTKKQNTNPYKKDQAAYPQKKKKKMYGAPFGVFVFIKTQTQTMYSQSKVKRTLTSVSPLMNTLNADACDIEIEKEEKKTLRYRDEKEIEFVLAIVRSLARIIPFEPAPVT